MRDEESEPTRIGVGKLSVSWQSVECFYGLYSAASTLMLVERLTTLQPPWLLGFYLRLQGFRCFVLGDLLICASSRAK